MSKRKKQIGLSDCALCRQSLLIARCAISIATTNRLAGREAEEAVLARGSQTGKIDWGNERKTRPINAM